MQTSKTLCRKLGMISRLYHCADFLQPTALIGMITWAVAYRFRGRASSSAYWIIFLVVWIWNTVMCLINVYNNITWESDLLYQLAPEYPQGNFWLGVLGVRLICRNRYSKGVAS